MSLIVNNLTISGFKVFSSDCEGAEEINLTTSSSDIYKYQNPSTITSSLSQTIYLTNPAGNRGGSKTVDTLSVMVNTADSSDRVEINGYVATRGVGSTGATAGGYAINWAVWASQATGSGGVPSGTASGNSPAYTVVAGSGTSYSLSQVLIASTYMTNNALNVSEGSNTLVIDIWNSTRTVKKGTLTYYVVIVSSSTRLSSLIPTLSPSVILPGYSYSPAFDSIYCPYGSRVYKLIVDPSATSMTLTPTTTVDNGAVISITAPNGTVLASLLSGQTSTSFAIADNNSVDVSVTAPDGTNQVYVLTIQSDVSGNNLATATFAYYDTPSHTTSFDQAGASNASWLSTINPNGTNGTPAVANLSTFTQFSYLNTIPNVSYGISVTLAAADSGASVAVGSATPVLGSGTFLVPYASLVQGAENVIVCSCISSTGIVKLYNFNIWLAGSDVSPATAGKLANISFNSAQAILDPSNPFSASNILTSSSLNFAIGDTGLPIYTVYVAPSTTDTLLTINLTYSDYGSRFSTKQCTNSVVGAWNPDPIETNPANTATDNWTLGSLRTVSKTIKVGVLTPGTSEYLLVASHLPGATGSNAYYGYALEFVTPKASLSSIILTSYETAAFINLNPAFNSIVESYSAYIGTAANPTRYVNLTTSFASSTYVDWNLTTPVGSTGGYDSAQSLNNGVASTITLGSVIASSYTLYVRLWNGTGSGAVQIGLYTLNLLNIDQSLLLSGLVVYRQVAPSTTTGLYPIPNPSTDIVTLSPAFLSSRFVYNAPISSLYGCIQPSVLNASVKTITISLNGAPPQVVISGNYFNFPMNAREIAAQITITDNLSPSNSNSYMVFIYSNSSDLNLSLANFSGILNSSFSPALPDGVTVTAPLTVSSGTVTTVTCSNAAVSSTRFTGTPEQAGTSMYLATVVGFEPLAPGVASSVISLIPNNAVSVPVWMYANDNTSTGTFSFSITQLPDTNSYLSNMILANCTNFTFNPTTQTYTGIILVAPNTTSSFIATLASSNSSMTYSFNGSSSVAAISGTQYNLSPTNYLPTTNVLTIVVQPQSGPTRTYSFTIVRNVNYYLSNLRVYTVLADATASDASTPSEVAVNPSPFSSTFFTYSAEVGPSIDTAYVVLSKAPESSISMTNATAKGLNTVGDQVWAVPVQVTTTPQNVLVYSINPSAITVSVGALSNVYNLAIVRQYPVATAQSISLSSGGVTIPLNNQLGVPTTFDPLVFTYTISPVYTGSVLTSIIGQGYNTYYLNGSPYYVPTSVIIDATHPIVVRVVNNDGSSSLYQFSLL